MARWQAAFVVAAMVAVAVPARAADPIQGTDVMGDKGRSGPDGWVWAPVTRDQAPGAKPAGNEAAPTPNKQQDPQAARTLPPGQDPGTPTTASAAGPGSLNTASGERKP